jgi:hypothetical protein
MSLFFGRSISYASSSYLLLEVPASEEREKGKNDKVPHTWLYATLCCQFSE